LYRKKHSIQAAFSLSEKLPHFLTFLAIFRFRLLLSPGNRKGGVSEKTTGKEDISETGTPEPREGSGVMGIS
jgi:hypothetical protein